MVIFFFLTHFLTDLRREKIPMKILYKTFEKKKKRKEMYFLLFRCLYLRYMDSQKYFLFLELNEVGKS